VFLSDWSEADFQGIEFDDLFALLYPYAMGTSTPYEKSVEGERYLVPREEYEKVICSYFAIDKERLRTKAAYSQQEKGYIIERAVFMIMLLLRIFLILKW